ncbi:MAG: sigma-70 family RNA polymerase sigma factor [Deltaproteobacteria bacterium]|nr:sigma-70 family RNA polymerase sigma factor [Deltaproteobacteria bacterium]
MADAYALYGPLVMRRCRRLLREEAAADDAAQEVFLRLWKYGASFREAESKLAWLYRVAERCCFDCAKRRERRAEAPLDETADRPEPRAGAQAVDDWSVVVRYLGRLDQRMRQVAVLHYLDEMNQLEIAAATGWTRQTVAKKLEALREQAARWRASLMGE